MSSTLRHTAHRESGKPEFETEAIALGQVLSRGLLRVGRGLAPGDIAGEARLLELRPGVPVVRLLHIDYDPQDRTLRLADDVYAADRHEFAFEWAEPDVPARHE